MTSAILRSVSKRLRILYKRAAPSSLWISMGYNGSHGSGGGCSYTSGGHFPLPGVSTWAVYIFINAGFNLGLCRKGKKYFIPKFSIIVRLEVETIMVRMVPKVTQRAADRS